ncbi:hypothetical protein GpartN1_g1955.t1 [Galdieria partita]|uniref:Uncharacterized protein n=1 Tax=Galdieria partita TaxID=83374 RepID=A0A9C7UNS6_9RHOD|nr:hypothetical protein GpartN1_g1955.t1 [Galdieria partita]
MTTTATELLFRKCLLSNNSIGLWTDVQEELSRRGRYSRTGEFIHELCDENEPGTVSSNKVSICAALLFFSDRIPEELQSLFYEEVKFVFRKYGFLFAVLPDIQDVLLRVHMVASLPSWIQGFPRKVARAFILRSPMNSVVGFTSQLRGGPSDLSVLIRPYSPECAQLMQVVRRYPNARMPHFMAFLLELLESFPDFSLSEVAPAIMDFLRDQENIDPNKLENCSVPADYEMPVNEWLTDLFEGMK